MVAFETMVLVCALGAGGDAVLLDFSATWCGPCQQMEPTVRRLQSAGYPVRKIDIDQHPELKAQFRVAGVPCFVLVSGGREVARVSGAQRYETLVGMFARVPQQSPTPPSQTDAVQRWPEQQTPPNTESPQETIRGQSPDGFGERVRDRMGNLLNRVRGGDAPTSAARDYPPPMQQEMPQQAMPQQGMPQQGMPQQAIYIEKEPDKWGQGAGSYGVAQQATPQEQALRASVRLTVESPSGNDIGSGTIIDVHGSEALVVTCGHIFRESNGKGRIMVEFCGLPGAAAVPGEVIAFDASRRDIALVAIRPQGNITAVRVAPEGFQIAERQRVFSVGCDNGGPARVIDSQVSGINRYVGPPNIEVSGQPTQGRSGGGLFSAEGLLIGICNAADPADNEGIYAALNTVHEQLAQVGLQQLFKPNTVAAPGQAPGFDARGVVAPGFAPPAGTPNASAAGVEVIVIMRPRDGRDDRSEAITIRNPSPQLLEMMQREARGAEYDARIVRGQSMQ